MVAAAGPEGVIPTARAAALLAGVLVLLAAIFVLSRWGTDLGLSPLPKPPDVLRERAREVTRRSATRSTPADSSGTFARDSSYLDFRARTGAPGWARWLATSWWKPATFNYRQSPRPLIPANVSIVRLADPPLNVTGMVTVILDPEGRLREFVAVPPQVPPPAPESPATPMWDVLLAEAGLDPRIFTRSDPAWLPSVPFDAIAGFTGPMPGEKDVTLRVVAAAFRGRPVSFQLVAPWSVPDRDAAAPVTLRSRIRDATFSLTTLLIAGAAAWFARRNTRLGRGDRRGAARVGTDDLRMHVPGRPPVEPSRRRLESGVREATRPPLRGSRDSRVGRLPRVRAVLSATVPGAARFVDPAPGRAVGRSPRRP